MRAASACSGAVGRKASAGFLPTQPKRAQVKLFQRLHRWDGSGAGASLGTVRTQVNGALGGRLPQGLLRAWIPRGQTHDLDPHCPPFLHHFTYSIFPGRAGLESSRPVRVTPRTPRGPPEAPGGIHLRTYGGVVAAAAGAPRDAGPPGPSPIPLPFMVAYIRA